MTTEPAEPELLVAVIYHDPSDYPGMYVVRQHHATSSGPPTIDVEPLAVTDTLEAAREAVPPQQSWRTDRFPEDDPTIVETWM